MTRPKAQPHILAIACVLMATATTGLTACGKFEVAQKSTIGVSPNSDPLQAAAEDAAPNLTETIPDIANGSERPDSAPEADRDTALDEARRIFDEELRGGVTPAVTPAVTSAVTSSASPAIPSVPATATASVPAPPTNTPVVPSTPQGASANAPSANAPSALLVEGPKADGISDQEKGQILLKLVEPTMRINFVLAKQRHEILALKKLADEKKELTKAQEEKLDAFKINFGLSTADFVTSLLVRVDTIPFSVLVTPLLAETNWGRIAAIAESSLSERAQRLNTLSSTESQRFRSARYEANGRQTSNEIRQMFFAEIGYNPEDNQQDGQAERLNKLLSTQMEVDRLMKQPGISEELDRRINEAAELLVKQSVAK